MWKKNLLAAQGFEPVPWWGLHNDSHVEDVEDIVQCYTYCAKSAMWHHYLSCESWMVHTHVMLDRMWRKVVFTLNSTCFVNMVKIRDHLFFMRVGGGVAFGGELWVARIKVSCPPPHPHTHTDQKIHNPPTRPIVKTSCLAPNPRLSSICTNV